MGFLPWKGCFEGWGRKAFFFYHENGAKSGEAGGGRNEGEESPPEAALGRRRREKAYLCAMKNEGTRALGAHLSLLGAAVCWGLMSPLGKDALQHGISGITLVSFRVLGGAILFWLASLLAPRERVVPRDRVLFVGAAIFGLVCNQCCFTIGLSLTSPINAGIVTTTMPIFALILSALILREPITQQKALGVALGCCGAFLLIWSSAQASGSALQLGDIRGDLLCVGGQVSYALYLTIFGKLAKKYSVFTVNKWMFLWASILLLPWTASEVLTTNFSSLSTKTLLEVGYVVFFGTFVSYLLMINGQRTLRPTVVSMYNYVQPIVAVVVSVILGLALFTGWHALAIVLIFCGVWLVTIARGRKTKPAQG